MPPDLTILEAVRWSLPSVLTLGALLSGLSAVRFASEGDFNWSVICVMQAAVLDGLDGHVARALNACSKIGFELDSLCDLANFGVSPALIVFFWAKTLPTQECAAEGCKVEHTFLWMSCCVYAACCALRLARFNVAGKAAEMDEQHLKPNPGSPRPPLQKAVVHNIFSRKMYFQGVPAPVGAAYALVPMMLRLSVAPNWVGRRGTCGILVFTGCLMISTLPTLSSKMIKKTRDDSHLRSQSWVRSVVKFAAGTTLAYLGWHFPFEIILLMNFLHLCSIPVGVFIYYVFAVNVHSYKHSP